MGYKLSRIIHGGLWLYGSSLLNNLSGFLYWLLISGIAGSAILGYTSATVGLGALIASLLSLGVNIGLQKYLGFCIGRNDKGCLRDYLWSTMLIVAPLYFIVGGGMMILGLAGIDIWNITGEMLFFAGIIVLSGFATPLTALFPSTLRTDLYFASILVGSILKLTVGVILVLLGLGWAGAVTGYLMVSLSIGAASIIFALKRAGITLHVKLSYATRALKAGVVSWLPGIIILAGQWLGVLSIFGTGGAVETGYYYIAFTISAVIFAMANSLLSLMLPVLSGMMDGRKRAASRVLRISLIAMTPIAAWAAVYPWLILGLMGHEYVSASGMLQILLFSSVPLAITNLTISLAYAYDKFIDVLLIGLFQNIPRILLYAFIVPLLGGLGSALSFTIGTYIGLAYSIIAAWRIGFKIDYWETTLIAGIPTLLFLPLYFLRIHWLIGILILGLTYAVYGRLRLLRRSDLRDLGGAFLPESIIDSIYMKLKPIIDLVLPST